MVDEVLLAGAARQFLVALHLLSQLTFLTDTGIRHAGDGSPI